MTGLGLALMAAYTGMPDELVIYLSTSTAFSLLGRTFVDQLLQTAITGQYPAQPSVQDMALNSEFLNNLNSKRLELSNDMIKVRAIATEGVPTPGGYQFSATRYVFGLDTLNMLVTSNYWNEIPDTSKILAIWLTLCFGVPVDRNGDFMVAKNSQLGYDVFSQDPKFDYKSYLMKMEEQNSGLRDGITAVVLTASVIGAFDKNLRFISLLLGGAILVGRTIDSLKGSEFLAAHGKCLRKVYETKLIDHALEDIITVGGNSSTKESIKSGISALSVGTSTSSFPAPSQTFTLLSNKNKDGSDAGAYHTITIEAISESNNHLQSAPIYFNGPPLPDGLRRTSEKKWISGVTVKEAPTAIKGVINTFLPKKIKSFEYSENFAAWKPTGSVDEWGNFTVKDLNFAEGQNVIAFRAESWIGNKMNQILNITLNTIPCLPSKFYPAPNSYTNNPKQKVGAEFTKSKYAEKSAGFRVLTCEIDGISVPYAITTGESTYTEWCKIETEPAEPLADGEHRVLIRVQTEVGISQALWAYTVDTTPPSIIIQPITPVSFRKPIEEK